MMMFRKNGDLFPFYVLNPDKTVRGTVNIAEWGQMRERHPEWIVQQDNANGYFVSTTFLGIPHFGPGDLNIFETMIFKQGDWSGLYQKRYDTWDEAVSGHARALAMALSGNVS